MGSRPGPVVSQRRWCRRLAVKRPSAYSRHVLQRASLPPLVTPGLQTVRERERCLKVGLRPRLEACLKIRLYVFGSTRFLFFFVSVHCKDCFMIWYSFYLVSDLNVPQMTPQLTCHPKPTVTCLAGFIVGSVGEPLTAA